MLSQYDNLNAKHFMEQVDMAGILGIRFL